MKIIALYGKGDRGKSTTLKNLIVKCLQPDIEDKLLYWSREVSIDILLEELQLEKEARRKGKKTNVVNIVVVLKIKGITVGITTSGDTRESLESAFEQFAKHTCDICFCASRTKGGTLNYLNERKANGENLLWVEKFALEGFAKYDGINDIIDDLNEQQAQHLAKYIE